MADQIIKHMERQLLKQAAYIVELKNCIRIHEQRARVADEQVATMRQVIELDTKTIARLKEEAAAAKAVAVSVYE